MGILDRFKSGAIKAQNAFKGAEAKFDRALERTAATAKATRLKNEKRKKLVQEIRGPKGKPKPNEALKLSSNPFRSEPSQNAFSSPSRPDYGVKNVIYGEPKKESSKPKKRRITVSFDE